MSERQKSDRPEQELLQWTLSAIKAQALFAAAELGVADELQEGPRSAEDLAAALDVNEEFLYRLLRALAGWGVFEELPQKKFRCNAMANCLRSDIEGSLRGWVRMRGQPWVYKPFGSIVEAVRTGQSGFRTAMGTGAFDYFPQDREASEIFDDAMTAISGAKFQVVAEAYDFSDSNVVVDVGGGIGGQLMAITRRYPDIRGVIADLASVVEHATERLEETGFSNRITAEPIDMFKAVPGGDTYLLGHILHDWDDDRCVTILENCRVAMKDGGRVLVIEHVVPEPNREDQALAADIEMMIMTEGGRERTLEEYDQLFERAGLKRTNVYKTESPWQVIEAATR